MRPETARPLVVWAWAGTNVMVVIAVNISLAPAFFFAIHRLPGGDNAGHVFPIGILCVLINARLDLGAWRLGGLILPKGSCVLAAVVFGEELSQHFLLRRTCALEGSSGGLRSNRGLHPCRSSVPPPGERGGLQMSILRLCLLLVYFAGLTKHFLHGVYFCCASDLSV